MDRTTENAPPPRVSLHLAKIGMRACLALVPSHPLRCNGQLKQKGERAAQLESQLKQKDERAQGLDEKVKQLEAKVTELEKQRSTVRMAPFQTQQQYMTPQQGHKYVTTLGNPVSAAPAQSYVVRPPAVRQQ